MKQIKENLILLMQDFSETDSKKLQVQQLLNLVNVLEVQDLDDKDVNVKIEDLMNTLASIKSGNIGLKKTYKKTYDKFKRGLQSSYGIAEKGAYTRMGTATGMTFGICLGAILASSISSSISLGLVLGMSIGAAIGTMKEKKNQSEGKIY